MRLTERLKAAMDPRRIIVAPVWGDPKPMTEVGRKVSRTFGEEPIDRPREALLQASLQRFVVSGTVANFTELKYVAHGITVPIGASGPPLIQRQDLLSTFLRLVDERRASAKQFRRCYQGLLGGYLGFDVNGLGTETTAQANWQRLRRYLDERLDEVVRAVRQRTTSAPWLDILSEHRNLLSDQPCERYAQALRKGETEELRVVCAGLGISPTSWVWDEALMAYVRGVVGIAEDRVFKRELDGVLALVNGGADLQLPSHLAAKATGMAVVRYRHCLDAVEHTELRDTSVRAIGNPWIQHVAWQAQVGDEPARLMVEKWLKRGLIKDFFNLLAHDGGADTRRLDYWLKWEPKITDMWFALGTHAMENDAPQFVDLRRRMAGFRLALEDAEDVNNAFIMRIGPLLVIEFGVKPNACYVFPASDFRANLARPRHSIRALKQKAFATRLTHMHQWEPRFDETLRSLLQKTPASKGVMRHPDTTTAVRSKSVHASSSQPETLRPSIDFSATAQSTVRAPDTATESPVARRTSAPSVGFGLDFDTLIDKAKASCERHSLKFEDHLHKGGAFWVLMPDPMYRLGFGKLLLANGFKYLDGKGFWIKRP